MTPPPPRTPTPPTVDVPLIEYTNTSDESRDSSDREDFHHARHYSFHCTWQDGQYTLELFDFRPHADWHCIIYASSHDRVTTTWTVSWSDVQDFLVHGCEYATPPKDLDMIPTMRLLLYAQDIIIRIAGTPVPPPIPPPPPPPPSHDPNWFMSWLGVLLIAIIPAAVMAVMAPLAVVDIVPV